MQLILASGSAGRNEMLKSVGIIPDMVVATDIDESCDGKELPRELSKRLSIEKSFAAEKIINIDGYIITADTICCIGRRILDKAISDSDVESCIRMLSGRRHTVYTSVTIAKKTNNICFRNTKTVKTIVKFKRLSEKEIMLYVASKEGLNKAGGCSIIGKAACFIKFISGSYSSVIGLPIYETISMLKGYGWSF